MLLEMKNVSKEFDGVQALRDVDLSLEAGEVRGLVGENGAGKSTLIKLLTGVYRLREGRVLWDGRSVSVSSPAESRALGIHAIHQDRTLIPTFDGIENAFLGLPYPTRHGRIDWRAMEQEVRAAAEPLGLELPLEKTAAELSPAQRTCLEIVRARMRRCRLLILDEPTAALTDREAEKLFAVMETLRREGTAILYVTHRLDEIFRLTDRVTVLRGGAVVDTVETAQVDRERLIAMMTDRAPVRQAARRGTPGEVLLEEEVEPGVCEGYTREYLRVRAPGQPGEICIRGTGLALGYYNDPEKTAAAFIQNPLQKNYPERIYCTGDIAVQDENGLFIFQSRQDGQVKHMGYRIELGEIERALASCPGISDAACLFDANKDAIVCCYAGAATPAQILAHLRTLVPKYMFPNVFCARERLPHNQNGKIDRAALKKDCLNG